MTNNVDRHKFFTAKFILVLVLMLAVIALDVILIMRKEQPPAAQPQAAAQTVQPAAAAKIDFDAEAAKLIGPPRNYTPTSVKAEAVLDAIKRGDFAAAEQALSQSLKESKIQGGRFRPFSKLVDDLTPTNNEEFLKRLNEWAAKDKNSALAYLLRAQYHDKTAWDMRGHKYLSETPQDHIDAFQKHREQAYTDATEAIRLDGNNPHEMYLLLNIIYGDGNSPEMDKAFRQAAKKYPDYYYLYSMRLNTLLPVWGGSVKEMYEFVDTYAGKADAHSALRLLYVELYADLIDIAWKACDVKDDALARCIDYSMHQLVTKNLEDHVYQTLNLYNKIDNFQYSVEIKSQLTKIIRTPGADRYAGALLQLTADATNSSIQLSATDSDTKNNNYIVDYLAGIVWYRKEHFDNVEKMYKRALDHIHNTRFPNDEEQDVAIADVYDRLAGLHSELQQDEKVIIYQKAADVLGGLVREDSGPLKCSAYVHLKLYDAAIKDCTAQIVHGGDIENVLWRARAYEESGQTDAALADYRIVAASQSDYRGMAAIEISVIYADRKDFQGLIDALNSYGYLFDEKREDKKNVAIAYNNRCYGKMHLGQLQEALKDCTTSLQYDSIPDAYQKQQELIKRLKAIESST